MYGLPLIMNGALALNPGTGASIGLYILPLSVSRVYHHSSGQLLTQQRHQSRS